MQSKKLIFNSDDFGYSKEFNEGIKRGYQSGVLTSTCILANGDAFDEAINEVLPEIENIGLGVHLNIIEGKSLTNPALLCDTNGCFNNGFAELMLKSKNKEFVDQVELEFRNQIEKVLSKVPIDHINSHVHTHAIPELFRLVCKLAKEYEIKTVRTQFEAPYIVPKINKNLSTKFPVNLLKLGLLNSFSIGNRLYAKKEGLKTNDYILGVTYTGYMDEDTILYGLKSIINNDCTAEILIHPTYFANANNSKPFNYKEYLITQSETIKEEIEKMGWILTNYKPNPNFSY